jgi:SAM-dependent methyltransferase
MSVCEGSSGGAGEVVEDAKYFAADADVADERARLRLIEQGSDPKTFQRLDLLGIAQGWRCLEVGAGAGSVAAWMGERVGVTGQVVAIDIDIQHLGWIDAPNVTVQRHDIVAQGFEVGSFDLVHCRALLAHLRDGRDRGLSHMVDALRPGGWLIAEDTAFGEYRATNSTDELATEFDSVMSRTFAFIAQADIFDPFINASLRSAFEGAGLEQVIVEELSLPLRGGDPMAVMFAKSWQRFDPMLIEQGVISSAEASARYDAHLDPARTFSYGSVVATGRRRLAGHA